MTTEYGDISREQAGYLSSELLKRGMVYMVFEKLGQMKPLPSKSTRIQRFRRYELLAAATTALTEGVTPAGSKLVPTDYMCQLAEYGDFVELTNWIYDTHQDPVEDEAKDVIATQAAETLEIIRFNLLKAGTGVTYANGAARNVVNTAMTRGALRNIVASLRAQRAKAITKHVASTANYNTVNVEPAFDVVVHTDLEASVRDLPMFKHASDYGHRPAEENEIGSVEACRFFMSQLATPFPDAGGAAGAMKSTTGVSADVYPVLIFGQNAWGSVPLKGKNAIQPKVVKPRPASGDPLGQRGTVGWLTYYTACILNELWMHRYEVACPA